MVLGVFFVPLTGSDTWTQGDTVANTGHYHYSLSITNLLILN